MSPNPHASMALPSGLLTEHGSSTRVGAPVQIGKPRTGETLLGSLARVYKMPGDC